MLAWQVSEEAFLPLCTRPLPGAIWQAPTPHHPAAMTSVDKPAWVAHKELADQYFRGENYQLAAAEYTHAINMCTGLPADRAKLFANRGLTFQRAGNHVATTPRGEQLLSSTQEC
jgi:hypothetical protein